MSIPKPSAISGWWVANESGARKGFTSDPAQALQVGCSFCFSNHEEPEGSCLLT